MTTPHDLPPIPDELNADPRFKHDMISHVRAYALAAIAPYKAEIVNLRQLIKKSGRTQLRERAEKAESEVDKLRKLLREARWRLVEVYPMGMVPVVVQMQIARIDAALGEKP